MGGSRIPRTVIRKYAEPLEMQGRLNQWAHWARAQGPRIIFFLFEGPPTGRGEIIF